MAKRSSSILRIITFAAIFVAIVVAVGVVIVSKQKTRLDFTYLEPTYLPTGVTIKDRRIVNDRGTKSAGLNFRIEDWVYSIREDAASSDASIGTADQQYDARSINPTCKIATTPSVQDYRLCHWVDYGTISVYEIKFVKGDTYVMSMIPYETTTQIPETEIEKYIDSFEPKSSSDLPILYSSGP